MKRVVLCILVLSLSAGVLFGCAQDPALENVGSVATTPGVTNATTAAQTPPASQGAQEVTLSEEQAAFLQECGISLEEFYAMPLEKQQMILLELGIVLGDQEKEDPDTQQKPQQYTTADVVSGGKYQVRIGDGWLNNYYLTYENGVLVKVEASFQKSSEEPPDEYLWEGENLAEFWYYGMTLDGIIDYFDQKDYGYTHSIEKIN